MLLPLYSGNQGDSESISSLSSGTARRPMPPLGRSLSYAPPRVETINDEVVNDDAELDGGKISFISEIGRGRVNMNHRIYRVATITQHNILLTVSCDHFPPARTGSTDLFWPSSGKWQDGRCQGAVLSRAMSPVHDESDLMRAVLHRFRTARVTRRLSCTRSKCWHPFSIRTLFVFSVSVVLMHPSARMASTEDIEQI